MAYALAPKVGFRIILNNRATNGEFLWFKQEYLQQ